MLWGPPLALSLFQHLLQGLLSSSGGDFPPWQPPKGCLCVPALSQLPSLLGQGLGTALGGTGTAQGGSIHGEPPRSTAECWKSSKKTPQPSWKKRINKERSTASGFFKLRVSGLVFFSPLARCPAGTLSRSGGGLCLSEGRTRLGMVPRAWLHRCAPGFTAPRPSAIGIAVISLWKSEMSQRCCRVRVCLQPPTHGTVCPRAR